MRSYWLENIRSVEDAEALLNQLLPSQKKPWLLRAPDGDAMAYFNLVEEPTNGLNSRSITVDISGRHYFCDSAILKVLKRLQESVGGTIGHDTENLFQFKTVPETFVFCVEVAKCLEKYAGKPMGTAIEMINRFWSHSLTFDENDYRLHEDPYYWAMCVAHDKTIGDNRPGWDKDTANGAVDDN